jgi:CelD/BcsL family acetyltransferase involved in cellulose biosynthesis
LRYVPAQYQRSFIDLEGSFPDYLKKFSSKLRWTLLRKVKRYAKHSGGEIRWRTYRDPTEMVEFHRLARKVSKRSYQELLGAGLPDGDEFQAQLRALAAQNRAREFILFSGDRPVAYMFCEISKGIVLSNYVGYDPEFQRWSPGTVLLYLALEHLFAEGGYLAFDFGEGGRQHKEIYSTHSIFCADIYLFRRSARTVPVVLLHAAWVQIVASAARFLNRFCRLTKLRRLLRMRARRSEEL